MRKVLFGVIITLIILFSYRYCDGDDDATLAESSTLIQEQIENVGKLIVTEGHFSEVFNYKNSKEIFGDLITADKKALVVVNAEVTIAYDLNEIKYDIDPSKKVLRILSIPAEEIKINPDLEYYDVQADYLNPFNAEDYNQIKEAIKHSLEAKLENSNLKSNAKNRLISELAKFFMVTNSMGWTLEYKEQPIESISQLETLDLKL